MKAAKRKGPGNAGLAREVAEAAAPMKAAKRKGSGTQLVIRLYIAGESPNSVIALSNLKSAIAHLAEDEVVVEVIDVLRHPERGLKDGILVTPTLIRLSPLPQQRVVGNLRDRAVLLAALRIGPAYDE